MEWKEDKSKGRTNEKAAPSTIQMQGDRTNIF